MVNRKPIEIGTKFGQREVIQLLDERKNGYLLYLVRCKCGNVSKINRSNLQKNPNRLCVNCSKYTNKKKGEENHNFKHGYATIKNGKIPEYNIWLAMRDRCKNINNKQYKDYGGRGISYIESWNDFQNFINDMGFRPTRFHTLDRINNDRGYYKENCRWATRQEQNRNRRNNVYYDLKDGTKINKQTMIENLGWTNSKFRRRFERYGIENILNEYESNRNSIS